MSVNLAIYSSAINIVRILGFWEGVPEYCYATTMQSKKAEAIFFYHLFFFSYSSVNITEDTY
jgi:hypothetical protein